MFVFYVSNTRSCVEERLQKKLNRVSDSGRSQQGAHHPVVAIQKGKAAALVESDLKQSASLPAVVQAIAQLLNFH